MMVRKSLAVFGLPRAGKKTLVGSLIYRCGLELPELERLEKNGITELVDIVPFYSKHELTKSFYTPPARYTVENNSTPNTAMWLVDATDLDHGQASSDGLSSLLITGSLRPKEKLLIVINKIDLVTDPVALRKIAEVFGRIDFGIPKQVQIFKLSK